MDRIEPEPLDGLLLINNPAPLPPERLKPALRIHTNSNRRMILTILLKTIPANSRNFYSCTSINARSTAREPMATSYSLILASSLVSLFNRRRKVRVRKQHNLSARLH
jgi:hypothetical protein